MSDVQAWGVAVVDGVGYIPKKIWMCRSLKGVYTVSILSLPYSPGNSSKKNAIQASSVTDFWILVPPRAELLRV